MRRRFFNKSNDFYDYKNYMTIEAIDDEIVIIMPKTVEYNIDGNGWNVLGFREPLPIKKGQMVSFKGNMYSHSGFGTISVSGMFNLKGNCFSLVFGDNAHLVASIDGYDSIFRELFLRNTGLIEVEKDFLPATTLAKSCYSNMFNGCTGLTVAPSLPATTLTEYCYYGMFNGCKSLNYIKMLAIDISATDCLDYWVYGVASTGTFVKNKDATWDTTPSALGNSGVPAGWTVVNDGDEEGGKIINIGRIKPAKMQTTYINWDFPVASNVSVIFHTEMSAHETTTGTGTNKSEGLMLGPGESELIVDYIEPIEDDTYIYEVIVEE
jgi:hypothetical protein